MLRAKVAVFVELFEKNRLLNEQTELMRRRLGVGDVESADELTALVRTAFERLSAAREGDAPALAAAAEDALRALGRAQELLGSHAAAPGR